MHKHQEGRLLTQRLIALFAAGWLLFSFPLLKLWLGSPATLFGCWALLIVLLALLMERRPASTVPGPADSRP